MAITCRRDHFFLFFLIIIALLSGCGSGGSSAVSAADSGDTFPAKILTWSPPSQYTDGTPLDPVTDLDSFEIYINEDGLFSDAENEMAAVSAVDSGTGKPITSFDLANLAPFLSKGVTYHVSVRTVALTGMKSDFSPGATFFF